MLSQVIFQVLTDYIIYIHTYRQTDRQTGIKHQRFAGDQQ